MNKNNTRILSFSGSAITALLIENVEDYTIEGRTIVVNPSTKHAMLDEHPRRSIAPLTSTVLLDVTVKSAEFLVLFRATEKINIGSVIVEDEWAFFGSMVDKSSTFPRNTPLWRSSQDSIANVEFDPRHVTGQVEKPGTKSRFNVKANLWLATAGTSCYIHNEHDFIEIHTQVHGNGRMQKFKNQDAGTLYEDILMSPGYTTSVPFCDVDANGKFVYPWHQYYADTDCIWLAVEYHPI